MKRFEILFRANTAADEGYLLWSASKILQDLQAICVRCCLTGAKVPWQLAMEGQTKDLIYVEQQICDIFDRRRGNVLINRLP